MDRFPTPAHNASRDTRLRGSAPRWFAASAIALGLCLATVAAAADDGPCTALKPVVLTDSPARWLGDCPRGVAQGVGVLRVGTKEPYQFFLGEMKAGAPVRGLMIDGIGWETALHFDAAGRNVVNSMEEPQTDSIFSLAIDAANATAKRFAAAGNRASAAYYKQLAKKVNDGEPE